MRRIWLIIIGITIPFILMGCSNKDTEAPVVTLKSNAIYEFPENSAEPNWDNYIEIADNVDTIFVVDVDDSAVDMSSIGTFDIVISVADNSGNEAIPTVFTITITDGRAPTILLKGDAVLSYPEGAVAPDWSELVNLNDDHDENVTLLIEDSLVDMNSIGTFDITFNSTDDAGNIANELTVTITIYDVDAPLITLNNSSIVEYEEQSTEPNWEDLVTVTDNFDSDLNVEVDTTNVDMETIGSFDVIYNATDTEGNNAVILVVTITITDATNPTIALLGNAVVDYPEGSSVPVWEDLVIANDNYDLDVSLDIDDSLVDMNTIGSFEITFDATDVAGNIATTLIVTINILDDFAPVITLSDEYNFDYYSEVITLSLDADAPVWVNLVTVTDNHDIDVVATVDSSAVDMNTLGTYLVTFNAVDAQGNIADSFPVTINIMDMVVYSFDFESYYNNSGGYGFTRMVDPLDETNTNHVMSRTSLGGRLAFSTVETVGKVFVFEYDFAVTDLSINPIFGINLSTSPFNNGEKIFFRYVSDTQQFEFPHGTSGATHQFGSVIPYTIEENTYYNLRLEVYGTHFIIYIDNQLLFEGSAIPLNFTEEIYITMTKPVIIDNVRVTTFQLDPLEDITAPVISQNPYYTSVLYAGQSTPYWTRMVVMNENFNLPYVLTIDDSAVDMDTVGTFDVIYQATDHQGNVSDPYVLTVTILEFPSIEMKVEALLTYMDNDPTPIWETLVDTTDQGDLIVDVNLNGNDLTVPGEYLIAITLKNDRGTVITSVNTTITITASDEYLANEAKDNIDLGDISGIILDMTLPLTDPNGATITWESDNAAITSSGNITRPAYLDGNTIVTLTATVTYNAEVTTRTFEVTVQRINPTDTDLVSEAKTNLDLGDISEIIDDMVLPLLDTNGAIITWESDNAAITSEGIVTRDVSGDVTVTLTATITSNGVTDTKIFIVTVLQEIIE